MTSRSSGRLHWADDLTKRSGLLDAGEIKNLLGKMKMDTNAATYRKTLVEFEEVQKVSDEEAAAKEEAAKEEAAKAKKRREEREKRLGIKERGAGRKEMLSAQEAPRARQVESTFVNTHAKATKGAWAQVDGRWGEIKEVQTRLDGFSEAEGSVQLKWLDGRKESWIKIDKLGTVVHSKGDVVSLGDLPDIELKALKIADIELKTDEKKLGADLAVTPAQFETWYIMKCTQMVDNPFDVLFGTTRSKVYWWFAQILWIKIIVNTLYAFGKEYAFNWPWFLHFGLAAIAMGGAVSATIPLPLCRCSSREREGASRH